MSCFKRKTQYELALERRKKELIYAIPKYYEPPTILAVLIDRTKDRIVKPDEELDVDEDEFSLRSSESTLSDESSVTDQSQSSTEQLSIPIEITKKNKVINVSKTTKGNFAISKKTKVKTTQPPQKLISSATNIEKSSETSTNISQSTLESSISKNSSKKSTKENKDSKTSSEFSKNEMKETINKNQAVGNKKKYEQLPVTVFEDFPLVKKMSVDTSSQLSTSKQKIRTINETKPETFPPNAVEKSNEKKNETNKDSSKQSNNESKDQVGSINSKTPLVPTESETKGTIKKSQTDLLTSENKKKLEVFNSFPLSISATSDNSAFKQKIQAVKETKPETLPPNPVEKSNEKKNETNKDSSKQLINESKDEVGSINSKTPPLLTASEKKKLPASVFDGFPLPKSATTDNLLSKAVEKSKDKKSESKKSTKESKDVVGCFSPKIPSVEPGNETTETIKKIQANILAAENKKKLEVFDSFLSSKSVTFDNSASKQKLQTDKETKSDNLPSNVVEKSKDKKNETKILNSSPYQSSVIDIIMLTVDDMKSEQKQIEFNKTKTDNLNSSTNKLDINKDMEDQILLMLIEQLLQEKKMFSDDHSATSAQEFNLQNHKRIAKTAFEYMPKKMAESKDKDKTKHHKKVEIKPEKKLVEYIPTIKDNKPPSFNSYDFIPGHENDDVIESNVLKYDEYLNKHTESVKLSAKNSKDCPINNSIRQSFIQRGSKRISQKLENIFDNILPHKKDYTENEMFLQETVQIKTVPIKPAKQNFEKNKKVKSHPMHFVARLFKPKMATSKSEDSLKSPTNIPVKKLNRVGNNNKLSKRIE